MLKASDKAPDFTLMSDSQEQLSLKNLHDRKLVLYFFPKAFTKGCTAEAREFAEASAQFTAAGATLIGMSADDIDTLHKFSAQECSSKFPVAADPELRVIKAFDSVMESRNISDRVSYVIGQDGKIAYAYSDRNPDKHVANTLAAVKALTKK